MAAHDQRTRHHRSRHCRPTWQAQRQTAAQRPEQLNMQLVNGERSGHGTQAAQLQHAPPATVATAVPPVRTHPVSGPLNTSDDTGSPFTTMSDWQAEQTTQLWRQPGPADGLQDGGRRSDVDTGARHRWLSPDQRKLKHAEGSRTVQQLRMMVTRRLLRLSGCIHDADVGGAALHHDVLSCVRWDFLATQCSGT